MTEGRFTRWQWTVYWATIVGSMISWFLLSLTAAWFVAEILIEIFAMSALHQQMTPEPTWIFWSSRIAALPAGVLGGWWAWQKRRSEPSSSDGF